MTTNFLELATTLNIWEPSGYRKKKLILRPELCINYYATTSPAVIKNSY